MSEYKPTKSIVTVKNNSSFKSYTSSNASKLELSIPMASASVKSNQTELSSSTTQSNKQTLSSISASSFSVSENDRNNEYSIKNKDSINNNNNKGSQVLEIDKRKNNFLKNMDQKFKKFSHQNKKSNSGTKPQDFSESHKRIKEDNNWSKFKSRLVKIHLF
jgi:hypothetical protein